LLVFLYLSRFEINHMPFGRHIYSINKIYYKSLREVWSVGINKKNQ